jgi:hypothetical protein
MINNILYLQLMYSYFFYNESNKYYMLSQTSSRKIKDSFKFIIIMNENEIIKKITLFSFKNKDYKHQYLYFYNSILENKKRTFFKSAFYENKSKIKIIGRGWKIIKYPYELLIKLGYSHPIFLTLDPYLSYKLKKKRKNIMCFMVYFIIKLIH